MHAYLAGPMAGMEFGNFPVFKAAAQSLRKRGHDVTSPVEMNDRDGEKQALEHGHPRRAEFMLRDLQLIAGPEIDTVVVLPGWEQSDGALAEVALARSIGKPVLEYKGLTPLDPAIGGREITSEHPYSALFHACLRELDALHDDKQSDYGSEEDPFANVRSSEEWGVPGWQGAMIRANDKVNRLKTYARKGTLKNEGVIDSFNDLAVYAVIARVLFQQEASEG